MAKTSGKALPRSGFERSRVRAGIFFIIPAAVLCFIFIVMPLIDVVIYSFAEKSSVGGPATYVGTDNYKALPNTEGFWDMALATVIFAFGSTLIIVSLSFFVAMALDSRSLPRVGRNIFRAMWFFPCILSGAVVGILWRIMYNYNNGVINSIIKAVGMKPVNWLETYGLTNFAVIIAAVWSQLGMCIVIFLAGLQGISGELMEAAQIDGASHWQVRRHIVLPLMAPSITINVLTTSIAAFKMYELPWTISKGLPGYSTRLLTQRIHFYGFEDANLGMGSAMSVLLIVVITIISLVQLFVLRRREDIY